MTEYLFKFEELLIRCDIDKQPSVLITQFIIGLRLEIKRKVSLYLPDFLEEAYHKALEIEKFRKMSTQRCTTSQAEESSQSRVTSSTFFGPVVSRRSNSLAQRTSTYQDRDASVTNPCHNISDIECHNCHGKSHITTRYPHHTLTLDYDTENLPTEDDIQDFEVEKHVSEYKDDNEGQDNDDKFCEIVRCILSASRSTNEWKRTYIFHTYVKCRDVVCKVIIDEVV